MIFKALSYIEVEIGSKEYRDFLLQSFDVGNLFLFDENNTLLFVGWKGTDMNGWHRFVNPNKGYILEFHPDEYKIKLRNQTHKFPYPRTVNDFIYDCNRVGLDLYWNQPHMDKVFEMKTYLNEKESKDYYTDLLTKIEKENVL